MQSRPWIKRFRDRTEGSVVIEAALGLPILLAVMVGVLEVGNYFFVNAALENAVLRASRFGVTGDNAAGTTREEQLLQIVEEETFGWIDMNQVTVETLVYEQFSDIGNAEPYTDANDSGTYDAGESYSDVNGNGQWDSDMAIAGLGDAGDIVLYRLSYPAMSVTGFGDWAGKSITIKATVAVRNEPF